MSDTSLVFNIIARDSGVGRALNSVKRAFQGAGDEATESLGKADAATEELKQSIISLESDVNKLGFAQEKSANTAELAQIRYAQAQDKSNALDEKAESLAKTRADAQVKLTEAQDAYNKISEQEGADKKAVEAAQRALNTEQATYNRLVEQEKQVNAQRELAVNRVTAAQLSLGEAQRKMSSQDNGRSKMLSELEELRSKLRNVGNDEEDTGGKSGFLAEVFARVGGAAGGVGGAVGSLASSISGALPPVGQLAIGALTLNAAMLVAPAAIYAVGAAAASLPGLLSGGIAALFTLKLGLSGLSENWKAMNTPKAGGGGGGGSAPKVDMTPKIRAVEAAQRQVAKSTRDITDAQADLVDATKAVNQARVDEKERIEDVRRSLASARADEEDSVQSLAEARMALATAEQRGNPDEIRRAQIAVDKQTASLAEAKDKTQDLQKESDEAAKKGVEGSDAVVAAKKREKEAQRAVQDAIMQHKLALQQLGDAQKSLNEKIAGAGAAAGGGLGVQLPKIAKSAQEFLDELKRLKPAFDDLRLDVQQRLFAGLADKLRIAAAVWLPALHKGLGGMADMINGVVKTAFDSISEPLFIKNTLIGVDAVRQALGKIGQAIAGPLVDAWGRLSAAAAPFIKMLGDKLAGIVTQFSNWIKKADESGKLQTFFEKATSIVGHLFDIFTNLARIAGSVISILFGTNAGSTDAWDNLAKATDKIADWMGNPKNQANIAQFIDQTQSLFSAFGWLAVHLDDVYHKGQAFIAWTKSAYKAVTTFFTGLDNTVNRFFAGLGRSIGAWGSRIWASLKAVPNNVAAAVRSAMSWFGQLGPWAGRALSNVKNYASNALSGLTSAMYNAGYNAVIGIWNGMSSLTSWLWNQVQRIGVNMWNAFMDGIGAHSPSRKFAEAGRWAMLGAGMGLQQNKKGLLDTAYGIAGELAGVKLGLGMDDTSLAGQIAGVASTVTVAAARRQQTVVVKMDVTGTDGAMKTMIQKMARTSNLYQTA